MPRIAYIEKRFTPASLAIIETANAIITEYAAQGFDLTLRQLFYQFVARGLIPNTDREYHRMGGIINNARLAGYIDWDAICDRTRFLRSNSHWDEPADIIRSAAKSFQLDKWEKQEYRPEVWIEKDALIGVIENICTKLDVPCISTRGYISQSEMWNASQRMLSHIENGQTPYIFHLADHDPSGIDMSADILKRMAVFEIREDISFNRLALNMDQVEEYNPPPNPTKYSDSRSERYIIEFGEESWELDSLEPSALTSLIKDAISEIRDDAAWNEDRDKEDEAKEQISVISQNWDEVSQSLDKFRKPTVSKPPKKSKKKRRRKAYKWRCKKCEFEWLRTDKNKPKICPVCRDKGSKKMIGEQYIEG